MDIGAFVLTIDDGREHLQLTGQEVWMSTIGGGMTIVMNVGMAQEVYERTPTKYTCPFCRCQNRLKGNNGNSSMGWWVFHWFAQLWCFCLWTLSRSCKRRFQVRLADRGIDEMEIASIANNEWDLIQNIYLRQGVSSMMGLQHYTWLNFGHFKLSDGAYRQSISYSFNTDLAFNWQGVRTGSSWGAQSTLTELHPLWDPSMYVMPIH